VHTSVDITVEFSLVYSRLRVQGSFLWKVIIFHKSSMKQFLLGFFLIISIDGTPRTKQSRTTYNCVIA